MYNMIYLFFLLISKHCEWKTFGFLFLGQFLLSSIPELIGVFGEQPMTGGVVTAEKIHTIGYNLSNLRTPLTDQICN